jgi:cobyrinic acid a,c-diamide synthase
MSARALIVSAPRSGSGKTTVALGLIGALARRGLAVRAFKAGPDYIEGVYHAAQSGAPACNLDSWAMPPPLLDAIMANAAASADMLVIEGAMGLFDGIPGAPGRSGSTADLAVRFGIAVLLVLDVSGQSQSAAATLRGFASHEPALRIAGVVLNRVGSERHARLVRDAIAALDIPVLGALPREDGLRMPERHLGLVQAGEQADLADRLHRIALASERHLDIDALIAMASDPLIAAQAGIQTGSPLEVTLGPAQGRTRGRGRTGEVSPLTPPGQCIAVAQDAAFSFVYPHIVDGWRHAGAQIMPFSPVADEAPPECCDCCWLPGGYPELHAATLAAAQRFRKKLAEFAETRAVHGECGGYMVLGQGIEDAQGTRHAMGGLLGHATSFANRKLHLGYREARLLCDSPIGGAGAIVRGHEFHYATLMDGGNDDALLELSDAEGRPLGQSGGRRGRVTGSFFHCIAPVRAACAS